MESVYWSVDFGDHHALWTTIHGVEGLEVSSLYNDRRLYVRAN